MKTQFYLIGDGEKWFEGGWNNPSSPMWTTDPGKARTFYSKKDASEFIRDDGCFHHCEVYKYKLTIRKLDE